MQLNRKKKDAAFDLDPAASRPTANRRTSITSRREIPVAAGQTVVVTPRLSPFYKGAIWFSLLLNAILLLVLLVVGYRGLRAYNDYKAILAQVGGRLNTSGAAGQTVQGLLADAQQGPAGRAQAVDTSVSLAQQKLGDVLGAVEGLQNATIKANIPINQQLPIALQVTVDQNTTVVLTKQVPLTVPASIVFPGGGGNLNATVSLNLPPGLELPVHLGMTIPLSSSVPVKFDVPINIPLKDTEMAGPFARLQALIKPLNDLFTPTAK